ncbi:hypothetical protein K2X05_07950 [bacterium]|nr:hypothetical protein [bacterium]
MNLTKACKAIDKNGMLLVFPINNQKEPRALWHEFYPRSQMRWVWDEDGDDRVMKMWSTMKKLSTDKRVVYSKWYQGRATFFSREVFIALRSFLSPHREKLSRQAQSLLEILESDSPLSTKQLKKMLDLQGKDNAAIYNKALKSLFEQLWIVGFGEVDDGAFPSLAVGATSLLYEDLESNVLSVERAQKILEEKLVHQPLVLKKIYKLKESLNAKM